MRIWIVCGEADVCTVQGHHKWLVHAWGSEYSAQVHQAKLSKCLIDLGLAPLARQCRLTSADYASAVKQMRFYDPDFRHEYMEEARYYITPLDLKS